QCVSGRVLGQPPPTRGTLDLMTTSVNGDAVGPGRDLCVNRIDENASQVYRLGLLPWNRSALVWEWLDEADSRSRHLGLGMGIEVGKPQRVTCSTDAPGQGEASERFAESGVAHAKYRAERLSRHRLVGFA